MVVTRRRLIAGLASSAFIGAVDIAGAQAAPAAVRPVLRRGSSGSAVVTLQRRLAALGYWCGSADGVFGHLTQQAVWAVQKVAGLSRDGVVGARTWGALDAGRRPTPRARSGTLIEVDKSRQIVMVVVSGALRFTLNTSTGSGERYFSGTWKTAYTPAGTYSIYSRYTSGWQDGPLGSMWRPAYWYKGWAIHGSTSIPPYPASHGCVRVSTSAMNLLYAQGLVPVGRSLVVY
ncbi:MAG: peptidoglycan-binding protein [Dermatophilaceae bacterium]|nr:L,D-transpeptidase family protein [Intrasporangiaceae bacterium]